MIRFCFHMNSYSKGSDLNSFLRRSSISKFMIKIILPPKFLRTFIYLWLIFIWKTGYEAVCDHGDVMISSGSEQQQNLASLFNRENFQGFCEAQGGSYFIQKLETFISLLKNLKSKKFIFEILLALRISHLPSHKSDL